MEQAYEKWKKEQTPANMGELLTASRPVLDTAIKSYGRGNQALLPSARRLAVDAFKTYDPSKGAKLQTHLMTQLQPLRRKAREAENVVNVPERVSADLYRLDQSNQALTDQLGREPSDRELADHTGLSMKRIGHVRTFQGTETAESQLVDPEGGVFYPGTEQPDPDRILIEYVHHDLDPVDQKILEWSTGLYGKDQLQKQEIANRLGLSPGAVSQRAAKIAKRLAELKSAGV